MSDFHPGTVRPVQSPIVIITESLLVESCLECRHDVSAPLDFNDPVSFSSPDPDIID